MFRTRLNYAIAALALIALGGCQFFHSELVESSDKKIDKSALDMYMVDRPLEVEFDSPVSNEEPTATASAEPGKYVSFYGRWQAKMDMKAEMEKERAKRAAAGKPEDEAAAKMGEAMMEAMGAMMQFELTINEDNTFTMIMMFIPMEGRWKQKGDSLWLYPDKVMGMSAEEFAKQEGGSGNVSKEPLELKIAPDNSCLIAVDEKNGLGEGQLVFKRPTQ